jgi:hypothetical protein
VLRVSEALQLPEPARHALFVALDREVEQGGPARTRVARAPDLSHNRDRGAAPLDQALTRDRAGQTATDEQSPGHAHRYRRHRLDQDRDACAGGSARG